MSDITGKEWGISHNWKNKGTEQGYRPEDRSTLFICEDCKEGFRHYYHVVPNIFEAMKEIGIPDKCVGKVSNEID